MPNVKSLSSESNNTVAFEMIIFSEYRNLCKDFLLKNIFGLKLLDGWSCLISWSRVFQQ